jgi:hypothetical protein
LLSLQILAQVSREERPTRLDLVVFGGSESLFGEQPDRLKLLQQILIEVLALQGGLGQSNDGGDRRSEPMLVTLHVGHREVCADAGEDHNGPFGLSAR